jgi:cytochrome c biogenesis protein CcmG/thiol:disulfide interchange protein DsbE
MKKRIFLKAFALVVTAFILSACGRSVPATAADLNLKDLNGNVVNLSDFKGKVIILDFFATWCPPCKQEIPDFIRLQNEYGDKGFTMIGISLSRMSDMQSFARDFGINYPVLIDDGYAAAVYGPIRSIPTTFVIDQNFKVVKKYIGFKPREVFEADIKALLSQKEGSGGK